MAFQLLINPFVQCIKKVCNGWFQSMSAGGPTARRSNFRQCTSSFRKLCCKTNHQFIHISINKFQRRCHWNNFVAKKNTNMKARAAPFYRWLISSCRLRALAVGNIQPNHPFNGQRLVPHSNLQTSAGRQCFHWLRVNCQSLCVGSVGSHHFFKHVATVCGRSRKSQKGGLLSLESNPLVETSHCQFFW